jgi:hypothetical protein
MVHIEQQHYQIHHVLLGHVELLPIEAFWSPNSEKMH